MAKIINTSKTTSKYSLPDGSESQIETRSNEAVVENMSVSFIKLRTSAKEYAERNSEVEQTLTLTNNSEYEITDLNIKDNISNGGKFKEGSVRIDNVVFENYDITTGFNIDSIQPGGTKVIKYTAIVTDNPDVDQIQFISNVKYSVNEQRDIIENSNKVILNIIDELIVIEKTANKNVAIKGDTLTFTHIVKNEGKIKNTEVFFQDILPLGVTFVTGSVKIDDALQADKNPSTGFMLKDLDANAHTKIDFHVRVD